MIEYFHRQQPGSALWQVCSTGCPQRSRATVLQTLSTEGAAKARAEQFQSSYGFRVDVVESRLSDGSRVYKLVINSAGSVIELECTSGDDAMRLRQLIEDNGYPLVVRK